MQEDLLIIKFQRQHCLIEIYSGYIQIPAQDCTHNDRVPLYKESGN